MKVFRTIALIGAIFTSIFFAVYADVQAQYAHDASQEVKRLREDAVALHQEAEKQQQMAIEAAAEARQAMNVVEELRMELETCNP